MFDGIAFAGGGNRCYWQGAFYGVIAEPLGLAPRRVSGVSAGAWQAVIALLGLTSRAQDLVIAGCAQGIPNIDWSRTRHPSGALFPVAPMYRALVEAIVDADAFNRLKAATDLVIAIARPPGYLPGVLAPLVGIGAYQLEKRLLHPVHPRTGRLLGFQPEFLRLSDMSQASDLVNAVLASATVPPFMPVTRPGGRVALDGGLVDNVPVAPLEPIEAAGGRTLVLLSRQYARLPDVPNRTYVQPSEPIRLGQFDITKPEAIRAAVDLGQKDGVAFLARL